MEEAQNLPVIQCESCIRLEAQLQEKQREVDVLRENLKTLKGRIIDSSKLLSIYTDTKAENEVLKDQNKKLREDFVSYKNENPIDVQIAQYKEMESQFTQLRDKCNVLQYTNEQLAASIENNQKAKEDNEKLKATVKEKEKQIQSLKDTILKKERLLHEYNAKGGMDKIKALESEIELLRNRNREDRYSINEPMSTTPPANTSFDTFLDKRVRDIIKQSIPAIARSVSEIYSLEGRQRLPSKDSIADMGSVGLPERHSIFQEEEVKSPVVAIPESAKEASPKKARAKKAVTAKEKPKPKSKKRKITEEDKPEEELVMDIGQGLSLYEAQKTAEKITADKKIKRKKRDEYNDWIIPKKRQEEKVEEKMDIIEEPVVNTKRTGRKKTRLTHKEIESIIADIMLVFFQ